MPQDCCSLCGGQDLERDKPPATRSHCLCKTLRAEVEWGTLGGRDPSSQSPNAQGPPATESRTDCCSLVVFKTAFIPSKKVAWKTLIPKAHLQSCGPNVTQGKNTGRDGEIQARRRLCSAGARLQQHSNRNEAGQCQLSACLLLSAAEKHTQGNKCFPCTPSAPDK